MNIATAIDLLFSVLQHAQVISTTIKTAQSEGRDVTPEELQALLDTDGRAREALAAAIEAARAAGR